MLWNCVGLHQVIWWRPSQCFKCILIYLISIWSFIFILFFLKKKTGLAFRTQLKIWIKSKFCPQNNEIIICVCLCVYMCIWRQYSIVCGKKNSSNESIGRKFNLILILIGMVGMNYFGQVDAYMIIYHISSIYVFIQVFSTIYLQLAI